MSSIAGKCIRRRSSGLLFVLSWIACCIALAMPAQRSAAAVVLEMEKDNTAMNNSAGTAQSIATGDFTLDPNPHIFTAAEGGLSGTALSVTIIGHTGGGTSHDVDFYQFTVFNNGYVWLDIDGPRTTFHEPDVTLGLFDSNGTLLAFNDDSFFDLDFDTAADADPGSHNDAPGQGTYDAFIGAIYLSAGTYYAGVAEYGNFANAFSTGTPSQHDSNFYPIGFDWWLSHSGATFGDSSWNNSGVQLPGIDYVLHISQVEAVPEPPSLSLMAGGSLALGWLIGKRRNRMTHTAAD